MLLGNGTAASSQVDYAPARALLGRRRRLQRRRQADLATANCSANTVSVLLGNGDGSFAARPTTRPARVPSAIAVGDFNGDGKADLAAADGSADTVSVLLGNGGGAFAANRLPDRHRPFAVAVGDFNGDGKTTWRRPTGASTVSVLLGNGDGSFAANRLRDRARSLRSPCQPTSTATAGRTW